MSIHANNVKLTIAYDGTPFLGWQKTKEGSSIEESLGVALQRILQHEINLQAASRTDAGVHARGQVVNFFTSKPVAQEKLMVGINSLLPKEIAVLKVEFASPSFHPTLDCVGKEYHYEICYGKVQMPLHRYFSWHFPYKLDLKMMKQAAKSLEGKHDFAAFCNFLKNSSYENTVREVHEIVFEELTEQHLRIIVRGSHFLYKMVRNIVGTLAYVGIGKIAPEEISHILESKDRTKAGISAPAHGLCLHAINY